MDERGDKELLACMKPTGTEKQPLISIVDDEACVLESLSSLFRSVGYRAEVFESAEKFLMEGKWDETACLILDVRLPGMTGLELQRRLTEMEPGRPPIVFISGHATAKDRTWAAHEGAVAFLRKPFSDEALLKAVSESIEQGQAGTAPSILFSFMDGVDVFPEASTEKSNAAEGSLVKGWVRVPKSKVW